MGCSHAFHIDSLCRLYSPPLDSADRQGGCRYERSQETQRMGKALVQRHVAQQHDLVNKSGEGLLVSVLSLLATSSI